MTRTPEAPASAWRIRRGAASCSPASASASAGKREVDRSGDWRGRPAYSPRRGEGRGEGGRETGRGGGELAGSRESTRTAGTERERDGDGDGENSHTERKTQTRELVGLPCRPVWTSPSLPVTVMVAMPRQCHYYAMPSVHPLAAHKRLSFLIHRERGELR
jgi:hypothetical protein